MDFAEADAVPGLEEEEQWGSTGLRLSDRQVEEPSSDLAQRGPGLGIGLSTGQATVSGRESPSKHPARAVTRAGVP